MLSIILNTKDTNGRENVAKDLLNEQYSFKHLQRYYDKLTFHSFLTRNSLNTFQNAHLFCGNMLQHLYHGNGAAIPAVRFVTRKSQRSGFEGEPLCASERLVDA